ncbi:holo-ACP synthase [uncultured Desulfuromonas sp.]|uniref:holo-ACP synthase n=1 Tax=uncultured Desulfuromonas sp. TaxID=181013 RepID=UPI002AABC6CB|nr:holo-ACP synthase [uncultured Desulfuromonas sp.]
MAIAGIGTDIVDVERFDRFIDEDNQTLLQRLFTPGELAYALPRKCAAQHLAARFACKEAFVKALGLGMRDGMTWHDIEVVRDALGCPSLAVRGRAAEILAQRQLHAHHVSYSHETRWAVATVIVEGS